MRLYVNDNEVGLLKATIKDGIRELKCECHNDKYEFAITRLENLLEGIELCEALQNNRRRSEK